MGEEQRQALVRLFAEDESFKAAIIAATSVDDAVRIDSDFGVYATVEDFGLADEQLTDVELEGVGGAGLLGNTNEFWCIAMSWGNCTQLC